MRFFNLSFKGAFIGINWLQRIKTLAIYFDLTFYLVPNFAINMDRWDLLTDQQCDAGKSHR